VAEAAFNNVAHLRHTSNLRAASGDNATVQAEPLGAATGIGVIERAHVVGPIQPGEVVVAEKIDRISRLPLPEAERLVGLIRAKDARLAVLGVVDLSDLAAEAEGVTKIVLESVQELLLKLAYVGASSLFREQLLTAVVEVMVNRVLTTSP